MPIGDSTVSYLTVKSTEPSCGGTWRDTCNYLAGGLLFFHRSSSPFALNNRENVIYFQAFFAKPVVATAVVVYAHLLSFGAPLSQNNTLHINLIDVNNLTRQTGSDVTFTCDFQPITFDVHHNLNRDFFLTKGTLPFDCSNLHH